MLMKVVTLPPEEFHAACGRLAEAIDSSGYRPDLVVAIAKGGIYVADAVLRKSRHPYIVTSERASTPVKRKLLPQILAHLPRALTDALRIAESKTYSLLAKIRTDRSLPKVKLPADLEKKLHEKSPASDYSESRTLKILVIDDAVDSGDTLLGTVEAIRREAPRAEIRTAVLTVTRPHPRIVPDYTLFPQGTLLRFPWALDFSR